MASRISSQVVEIPWGGVRPDLDPFYAGLRNLVDAENMIFDDGRLKSRFGLFELGSTTSRSGRCQGFIEYVDTTNIPTLVKGVTTGWVKLDGLAWTDITDGANQLTANAENLQIFRIFQRGGINYLLGVNGQDAPKVWNGVAASYADMGGSPQVAKCLAVSGGHVLLGNLSTSGPIAIDVSADNDFDAGWGSIQLELLTQSAGSIVAMQEMSEFVTAIYKTDAIHTAQFVGQIDPFRFPIVVENIRGPMSPQAVVALNDGTHVYLADDSSVLRFNGTSLQELILGNVNISSIVRRIVGDSLQIELQGLVTALYNSRTQEIWFHYPENTATDNNRAIVINLKHQNVMPIRYNTRRIGSSVIARVDDGGITFNTWLTPFEDTLISFNDMSQAAFRHILGDSLNDKVYTLNALTDDGENIKGHFETGMIPVSSLDRQTFIEEVESFIQEIPGSPSLTIQIGLSQNGDTRELTNEATVQLSQLGKYINGIRKEAKFISMRINFDLDQQLIWRGANIKYRMRGQK